MSWRPKAAETGWSKITKKCINPINSPCPKSYPPCHPASLLRHLGLAREAAGYSTATGRACTLNRSIPLVGGSAEIAVRLLDKRSGKAVPEKFSLMPFSEPGCCEGSRLRRARRRGVGRWLPRRAWRDRAPLWPPASATGLAERCREFLPVRASEDASFDDKPPISATGQKALVAYIASVASVTTGTMVCRGQPLTQVCGADLLAPVAQCVSQVRSPTRSRVTVTPMSRSICAVTRQTRGICQAPQRGS